MSSAVGSSKGSTNAAHEKTASLYVGNLPPNVTEAKLLEKFSAAGAVCSVKICRDKATKRFLGYAYINFRRRENATQAIEMMNGRSIGGRPIRVMWPERNPSHPEQAAKPKQNKKNVTSDSGGSQENRVGILITGLNPAIKDGDLRALFASSGSIVDCGVGLDDNGLSKGFGFVEFESDEAVEACLERVKGWLLTGSTLSVTKLYTNVHVFNFGYRLNFGSLRDLFGQYGSISVYRIVKNDGKYNGFGYVTFRQLKSAAHAVIELNGKDLGDGLKLKVQSAPCPSPDRTNPSPVREKPGEGVNLYIKIMESSVTKARLHELFSSFGPISSVKVLKAVSNDQQAALVRFASEEDAANAIAEMNGKVVGNGPLAVSLAIVRNAKPSPAQPAKSNASPKAKQPKSQSLEEKRKLAERLYLVVKQLNGSMAGSITVRLLERDDLQRLMQDPGALKAKVDETVVGMLLSREKHLKRFESAPAGSAAA